MRVQDDGVTVSTDELLQPLPLDLPQSFNWYVFIGAKEKIG